MKKMLILASAAAVAAADVALAQENDTTPRITFGAFVDGYYAYDFGRPASHDRAFTTQAARHDELNVNLAHVEVRYVSPKVRGRVALQAGTSVQFQRGPAVWRTELKTFFGAEEAIFPDRDGDGGVAKSSTALVTSLSVRI